MIPIYSNKSSPSLIINLTFLLEFYLKIISLLCLSVILLRIHRFLNMFVRTDEVF